MSCASSFFMAKWNWNPPIKSTELANFHHIVSLFFKTVSIEIHLQIIWLLRQSVSSSPSPQSSCPLQRRFSGMHFWRFLHLNCPDRQMYDSVDSMNKGVSLNRGSLQCRFWQLWKLLGRIQNRTDNVRIYLLTLFKTVSNEYAFSFKIMTRNVKKGQ